MPTVVPGAGPHACSEARPLCSHGVPHGHVDSDGAHELGRVIARRRVRQRCRQSFLWSKPDAGMPCQCSAGVGLGRRERSAV
jgi:hypothetical protein